MIRPITLNVCETWATTKTDEQNIAIFLKKKVLRQIFDPRRNLNTGECKRISWPGHVCRGQEQTNQAGSQRGKYRSAVQDKDGWTGYIKT